MSREEEQQREEDKQRRAAGADAVAERRGFLPLMPLPEAPKYPCPYLSQEEITKYLAPLYDQGWRIGSSHFTLQKHVAPSAQEAPELAKAFLFLPEREEAWIAFIEEVAKIQSQEDVSVREPLRRPVSPPSPSTIAPCSSTERAYMFGHTRTPRGPSSTRTQNQGTPWTGLASRCATCGSPRSSRKLSGPF